MEEKNKIIVGYLLDKIATTCDEEYVDIKVFLAFHEKEERDMRYWKHLCISILNDSNRKMSSVDLIAHEIQSLMDSSDDCHPECVSNNSDELGRGLCDYCSRK